MMTMTHMVSLGLNELSLVKQKQGQIQSGKRSTTNSGVKLTKLMSH